jgi:hypothetical protein
MIVWVVYEFEFHELYDLKIFSLEDKANEYRYKRIKDNEELYKTDMEKHIVGFNIEVEEQKVL